MRHFRSLTIHLSMSAVCLTTIMILSPLCPIYSVVALSVASDRKPSVTLLPSQKKQHRARKSILFDSSATTSSNESTDEKQQAAVTSSSRSSFAGATIPEEIFNLVKSIIGAGVLSLPAGIALMASNGAVSNSNTIVVSTACLLVAVMGGISAYTFSLIARVCTMTNSSTYAECWKATRGSSFAWVVALSSTLDCFAGNLTFSMVLADTFRQLFSSLFEFGAKNNPAFFANLEFYNTRSRVLLLVTVTSLIPLCCVKNLSSLAPFSLVGILGILYTAFVIGLRYFDSSYKLPNGRFLADLESAPSFLGTGSGEGASLLQNIQNPKALIFVSMLSTAFIAHFNAPKFYRELKDADSQPKRFHLGVVAPSFAACVLFYAFVSSMGYLTFGSATKGMILSNYSTNDILISLSRFALGISLITSYPLLFVGLRSGIVDLINQLSPLLNRGEKKDTTQQQQPKQFELTDRQSDKFTVVLVSLITILALKTTDITFVASMSGALLGTSLIFIFPPLMFRSALVMESKRTNTPFTNLQRFERRFCSVIVALGVFIAGVGAKIAWTR